MRFTSGRGVERSMTRLAMILLAAWVLWLETNSPKGQTIDPKGAFPTDGYQACLKEAKTSVDKLMSWFTEAKFTGVGRYSSGGTESIMADLIRSDSKSRAHWTYRCLPDTIDPRQSK
jgi:hypothetical protein